KSPRDLGPPAPRGPPASASKRQTHRKVATQSHGPTATPKGRHGCQAAERAPAGVQRTQPRKLVHDRTTTTRRPLYELVILGPFPVRDDGHEATETPPAALAGTARKPARPVLGDGQ